MQRNDEDRLALPFAFRFLLSFLLVATSTPFTSPTPFPTILTPSQPFQTQEQGMLRASTLFDADPFCAIAPTDRPSSDSSPTVASYHSESLRLLLRLHLEPLEAGASYPAARDQRHRDADRLSPFPPLLPSRRHGFLHTRRIS